MVSAVASVDQLIPIQGEDDGAHPVHRPEGAWRLLIIDDDNEVHRATRFAIRGVEIEGRPIEVLSAHSAAEGEAMMRREADIGCILLDVVMETPDAGLCLIRRIREEMDNAIVRIVLRTGQPGQAPELEVVQRYDINDYKQKSELNRTRLLTTLIAAFRSYDQLCILRQRTTELEASSAELMRKSQAMDTILDNISQGITLFDADLRLVACNRRLLDLAEFPPELARPGTPFEAFIRFNVRRGEYGPGEPEFHVRKRMEWARDPLPHHSARTRPDGTVLDIIGQPVAGGGFVSTYTDITESVRHQEALETLSRAVEQSPVSVIFTNPDGSIEYVNPKVLELTGYTEAELLGQNPRIFQSGLTPPEVYRELWGTLVGGQTWEGDIHNRKKSGELYWEHASISPVRSPDGVVMHYVAVKEDISHRKLAEADLRAALEAARAADHAKTVFLSHISHELRTPMTAVLGYGEMMEAELAGPLNPTYKEYVGNVLGSGRHLLAIIDDLLEISRIELGRYTLDLSDFDLAETVAACTKMIVPMCAEKGIALTVHAPTGLAMRSDEHAIRQIMVNLLSNAVKYTPAAGSITVGVGAEGDVAMVTVGDTGQGIPDDLLHKVFEPFQRADPMRADPSRGVGLGLAICRRIVGVLHGHMEIRSQLGQGTEVTMTLPLRGNALRENGCSSGPILSEGTPFER